MAANIAQNIDSAKIWAAQENLMFSQFTTHFI
jgi:hypothetical protein